MAGPEKTAGPTRKQHLLLLDWLEPDCPGADSQMDSAGNTKPFLADTTFLCLILTLIPNWEIIHI